MAQPAPDDKSFQFSQFDSLSPDQQISTAQNFFSEHFKVGSDVAVILASIKNAGADCFAHQEPHTTPPHLYYLCNYHVPLSFWKKNWIIKIDTDDNNPNRIASFNVDKIATGL
jgi:hypothetical protein